MSKRLAITISGAVSLGSYEAGVLYEVITALGEHNVHADTTDDERIHIDVLTGASAGGMSAVITAQTLLYSKGSFVAPDNNPLYNPWVADISLDGLLKLDSEPDPEYADIPTPEDLKKSIFSSNLIEKLARKYITRRYEGAVPKRDPHPAGASQIRLGLALSNLNGVAYSYPLRVVQPSGNSKFEYTRFQDEMTGLFSVDGAQDDLKTWKPWREAAVSCGAFPFAFRVKQLRRFENEYTREHRDPWDAKERDFVYTDGGIFQNEPLGLAKNLVDLIDRPAGGEASQFQNADTRFYLYVAPGGKTSDVNSKFTEDGAEFLPTGQAIAAAVLHQAKFQDWVNAEEINDQINIFNVRAEQLYGALMTDDNPGLHEVLQKAADALLPGLFQTEPPPAKGVRDMNQGEAEARLRTQFDKESASLKAKKGAAVEQAWIDSILVLETAANLNLKDEMYIYGITATNQELAGGGLFAFEGFFDFQLRLHDYNLGRAKAREFLLQHREGGKPRVAGSPEPVPDIGPIRYNPTDAIKSIPVPERDEKTGDLLVSKLDPDIRKKLLDAVDQRADEIVGELLKDLNVGGLFAPPVRWALDMLVKNKVKEKLSL